MKGTILVVDDEPLIVSLLVVALQDEGYAVRSARDGLAAFTEIGHDRPDLVLSDVMMPRLDGVTLVARLRARGDETPVVLMSAVVTKARPTGVEFVAKPFDLETLVGVVNRTWAKSAA